MLVRQLSNKNFCHLSEWFRISQYSHKSIRQFAGKSKSPLLIYKNTLNNVRYASTSASGKRNIAIFGGICAVGGTAIAYNIFRKKSPMIDVEDDSLNEKPFVDEGLAEDLALLTEHGPIPYLLIGGGCASFTAYKSIRARDPTAKILLIGEEPVFPYMRPPLSKEMWYDEKADADALVFSQWSGKPRSVFYENEHFFFNVKEVLEHKNGGLAVIRGKKVIKIDPLNQTVHLDKGEKIAYQKCLIATGSKPKNLPALEKADPAILKHVTLFRTVKDFQNLAKIFQKSKSVVVIGGGFLGSELACGLGNKGRYLGVDVTQIFPEKGVLAKVLPEYLSQWSSDKIVGEGVKIIPHVEVKSVSKEGNDILLHLSNSDVIRTNHVVVAVGADANTELAKTSGLEIHPDLGGFLVNTELEARKNLYVAGDAACFYDTKLGRRRVEHHDHAVVSGKLAGGNMTGEAKPYLHQSMFWSDLGPHIGFEAIGIVDSSLPTIGVFNKPTVDAAKISENVEEIQSENKLPELNSTNSKSASSDNNFDKGVVFYLRDNLIVGMIFWNLFGKMPIARQIINESKSSDDIVEITKLFEIYSLEE